MQYRHLESGLDVRAMQLSAEVLDRIGARESAPDWPTWFADACLRGAVHVRAGGSSGEAERRFVVNAPNGAFDGAVGDWVLQEPSGRLRTTSERVPSR